MMMAWRKEYGIELLDAIDCEPGRILSHYLRQFKKERTAFFRHEDLLDEGLIEAHEDPSGRRTLTLTDKGRKVLEHCRQIAAWYWEGSE